MTTVVDAVRAHLHATAVPAPTPLRIALLGVGRVGGSVAELLRQTPLGDRFSVVSGLVRDMSRARPQAARVRLTASVGEALDGEPDLVIEALGGLEPARTLVLNAIERHLPVVTANKSLLAAHGEVLLDAAAHRGVPLRYEAAVLAGVPFLGTFARRSLARNITGLSGVVNGTTNFILSRMADERSAFAVALAQAQARGYAEPDPASDVNGVDAAEKLCILLRHFGDWSVTPANVEMTGITSIESSDLQAAAEFGGAIKPVVFADWRDGSLSAFAGPAFVASCHPLARVNGVQNAVLLGNRTAGELFFAGPGAGPAVTAATLLDDAAEVAHEAIVRPPELYAKAGAGRPGYGESARWKRAEPIAPATGWFIRVSGDRLPDAADLADLLSAYGVWLRRASEHAGSDKKQRWFLTYRCEGGRIADALRALDTAARCRSFCVRVLES